MTADSDPVQLDHYEIVKRLIGPCHPVGETRADEVRLANIKALASLAHALVDDLRGIATAKDRREHSMRECGKVAEKTIASIREDVAEAMVESHAAEIERLVGENGRLRAALADIVAVSRTPMGGQAHNAATSLDAKVIARRALDSAGG